MRNFDFSKVLEPNPRERQMMQQLKSAGAVIYGKISRKSLSPVTYGQDGLAIGIWRTCVKLSSRCPDIDVFQLQLNLPGIPRLCLAEQAEYGMTSFMVGAVDVQLMGGKFSNELATRWNELYGGEGGNWAILEIARFGRIFFRFGLQDVAMGQEVGAWFFEPSSSLKVASTWSSVEQLNAALTSYLSVS